MKALQKLIVNVLVLLLAICVSPLNAKGEAEKKPAAKPCVEKIHIIYGCHTCEAMMDWLKKGGVKIEIKETQTGPYRQYPVVIYSDKTSDHGEVMYQHEASIPAKLCVIRCNVGTE